MAQFKVRRDSSTNNVPTVGYNDGVDAQDVILFSLVKKVETVVTDGTGTATVSSKIASKDGVVYIDSEGVKRGRILDDEIVINSGSYFAGNVSAEESTLKVYTTSERTTVVVGESVEIEYYAKVPVAVSEDGEVITRQAEKHTVILKKEGTIAAGASETIVTMLIGDSTKDMYITGITAYYNGTGATTDLPVAFWFSYREDGEESDVSFIDMAMPARANGMMNINFGDAGIKLKAGSVFKFETSSGWLSNYIHVFITGWQY